MEREDAYVGLRVVAINKVDGNDSTLDKEGTVVSVDGWNHYELCVEFDEPITFGHDGVRMNGGVPLGEYGRCFYGLFSDFEPVVDDELCVDVKIPIDEII